MKSKSKTYRIIALTMAFLIFFSSAGFSLDLHYCQGKVKSFSLFGKAKSCYQLVDASSSKDCIDHHKKTTQRKNARQKNKICSVQQQACCSQQHLQFQLDQNQQKPNSTVVQEKVQQQFIASFVVSIYEVKAILKTFENYQNYKPPLISRDFPVLFESFLL